MTAFNKESKPKPIEIDIKKQADFESRKKAKEHESLATVQFLMTEK